MNLKNRIAKHGLAGRRCCGLAGGGTGDRRINLDLGLWSVQVAVLPFKNGLVPCQLVQV
jgi:hypothetical protein